MRRGTSNVATHSSTAAVAAEPAKITQTAKKDVVNEITKLQNDSDQSTSSEWITELPTRSSSVFSDPTGFSSFVTSEESTKQTSLKTTSDPADTESKQKHRKKSASIQSSSAATSSASNTSQDHPPLPRINLTEEELKRQAKTDQHWQQAVNAFLQHDPVSKTPRQRTRSEYLIRRNYCLIKRETGIRWKKTVEKFQARKILPSIPISNSEWSEA
uniref:Uncharacterized protein n=1 Tax=Panagrolaimus sp. PS1159 TaxID=55785 RepID=A0AC35FX62_9BILA